MFVSDAVRHAVMVCPPNSLCSYHDPSLQAGTEAHKLPRRAACAPLTSKSWPLLLYRSPPPHKLSHEGGDMLVSDAVRHAVMVCLQTITAVGVVHTHTHERVSFPFSSLPSDEGTPSSPGLHLAIALLPPPLSLNPYTPLLCPALSLSHPWGLTTCLDPNAGTWRSARYVNQILGT